MATFRSVTTAALTGCFTVRGNSFNLGLCDAESANHKVSMCGRYDRCGTSVERVDCGKSKAHSVGQHQTKGQDIPGDASLNSSRLLLSCLVLRPLP